MGNQMTWSHPVLAANVIILSSRERSSLKLLKNKLLKGVDYDKEIMTFKSINVRRILHYFPIN